MVGGIVVGKKWVKMKIGLELEQQIIDYTIYNDTYFVNEELHNAFQKKRQLMYREYMNLKEEATRQALIKLGWTPPDEMKGI